MANTNTNVTVSADTQTFEQGMKKVEQSLSKGRESAQKFGQALSGLGTEFGNAGRLFGTFASALASGSAIGAAIIGIQELVRWLGEMGKESAEAAKTYKKMMEDIVTAQKKATDELERLKLKNAGGTAALEFKRTNIDNLDLELVAKRRLKKALEDENAELLANPYIGSSGVVDANKDTIRMLEKEIKERQKVLDTNKQVFQEKVKEEELAEKAKSDAEARAKGEAAAKQAADAAKRENERKKEANQEFRAWLESQDDEYLLAQAQAEIEAARKVGDDVRAMDAEHYKRLLEHEILFSKKRQELKKKGIDTPENLAALDEEQSKAGEKLQENLGLDTDAFFGKKLSDGMAKWDEEQRAKLKEQEQAWRSWGRQVAGVLAGVVTGQITVAQAFQQLTQMVISSLMEMAIQAGITELLAHVLKKPAKIADVMAAAAVGGAETAAQVAAIPLIGPAAAVAAGEAMQTAIAGAFLPVASAAGGWDLPSFSGGTPAILHSREMVLPQQYADKIRNMSDTGGVRSVVIQALDTKSFYQAMKANDGQLLKVLNSSFANRRFA